MASEPHSWVPQRGPVCVWGGNMDDWQEALGCKQRQSWFFYVHCHMLGTQQAPTVCQACTLAVSSLWKG